MQGDDGMTAGDGGAAPATIDDPVFDTAVRDIMSQVNEERREERRARWEERRKQTADRWAGWLSGELGLSDAQKQKVAAIVQDYFKRMQEQMWNPDAGAMTRSERRDSMRSLRADSEKKLGQVLDPQQMDKYDALDDDQKIGFGFGGGRRPRGGGGPGGPGP
jgi:hypothetical protein